MEYLKGLKFSFDASRRGNKMMLNYCRDEKRKRITVAVGRGEEGPLCDPGSELLLGGRERESSAKILKGMKRAKKRNGDHVSRGSFNEREGDEESKKKKWRPCVAREFQRRPPMLHGVVS